MNHHQNYYDHFETPLGVMQISANADAVVSIYFVEHVEAVKTNALTELAKHQLLEYFYKARTHFDIPLQTSGTAFQQQVWKALTQIKHGATCSYSDIATSINNPRAVRAVGAANGKNPMTIVVPCHRVIGANGSLTGYASGTERKAWLLAHESN